MSDGVDTRRALCSFEAEGLAGAPARGEGEALVDDDGVSVAGVRVEFLDVDALTDERRVLTLAVHPAGTLRVSMLARRHDERLATASNVQAPESTAAFMQEHYRIRSRFHDVKRDYREIKRKIYEIEKGE